MDYDKDKLDRTVLALLYLNLFDETEYGARAWKGFDWPTMERLHAKGYLHDPKSKAKSVHVTPKGVAESRRLFEELFGAG